VHDKTEAEKTVMEVVSCTADSVSEAKMMTMKTSRKAEKDAETATKTMKPWMKMTLLTMTEAHLMKNPGEQNQKVKGASLIKEKSEWGCSIKSPFHLVIPTATLCREIHCGSGVHPGRLLKNNWMTAFRRLQ